MHWIVRDPSRFLHEREQLSKLSGEVDWITNVNWRMDFHSLLLEVDIDLNVHGTPRPVTLTYPAEFPITPAYVSPRDSSQLWSGHQYGAGGPFCLEWRADNWDPRVTGSDLVRSTYTLLATESDPVAPARVPSAHHLTPGQEVRAKTNRLVATPALFAALAALPPEGVVPLRSYTLSHNSTFICFIAEVGDANGTVATIGDVPKALTNAFPLFIWAREGFAIKSDAIRAAPVETLDQLRLALAHPGLTRPTSFVDVPATPPDGFYLLYEGHGMSLEAISVIGGELIRYSVLRSEADERRLPPAYTHLKDIRLAIVGLGSLGSKIAVSLARCGCRQFVLVDDDIMLPENLCRHELSWMAVGMHKAKAVKEALSYIAPDIEVDVRIHRLAGQESSSVAAKVLKALSSCHLIIDATADPDVFLRLAAIAQRHNRPMCWGEVFAGGVGGLVARAVPGAAPNPVAIRAGIQNYLQGLPPAPFSNARRYDVNESEPIIADDADVSHIASAVARLALDTLVHRDPTAFPHHAYLIGLRKEWIFSGAFDTQPIEIGGADWANEAPRQEDLDAAIATLAAILKDIADDYAHPPAADPGQNSNSAA